MKITMPQLTYSCILALLFTSVPLQGGEYTDILFELRDSSDNQIALITEYGDLIIASTLDQNKSTIDNAAELMTIVTGSANKGKFKTDGGLEITGVIRHQNSIVDKDSYFITFKNDAGTIVAAFEEDSKGNLNLDLAGDTLYDRPFDYGISFDLRVENKRNPIGLDPQKLPRFSWRMKTNDLDDVDVFSSRTDLRQWRYSISVFESITDYQNNNPYFRHASYVSSSQSHLVEYPDTAPALQSGHRYYWYVNVSFVAGGDSYLISSSADEEAPAFFEMGLDWNATDGGDWGNAKWIGNNVSNLFLFNYNHRTDSDGFRSPNYYLQESRPYIDIDDQPNPEFLVLDLKGSHTVSSIVLKPITRFSWLRDYLQISQSNYPPNLEENSHLKTTLDKFLFPFDSNASMLIRISNGGNFGDPIAASNITFSLDSEGNAVFDMTTDLPNVYYIQLLFPELSRADEGHYGYGINEIEVRNSSGLNILKNAADQTNLPEIEWSLPYPLDAPTDSPHSVSANRGANPPRAKKNPEPEVQSISHLNIEEYRQNNPYRKLSDTRSLNDGLTHATRSPAPSRIFRESFGTPASYDRIMLYVAALGVCQVRINSTIISHTSGESMLAAEWTDYKNRVLYQSYEIDPSVFNETSNQVYVTLVDGFYSGRLGADQEFRRNYGKFPLFILQMRGYNDGQDFSESTEIVKTDSTNWGKNNVLSTPAPIRMSCLMDGEVFNADYADLSDLQYVTPYYSKASFGEELVQMQQDLRAVDINANPIVWAINIFETEDKFDSVRIQPQMTAPICQTEVIEDSAITNLGEFPPSSGVYVFDMGKQITGRCRISFTIPEGKYPEVAMRHAEALNNDGTIYMANQRSALETDIYIKDNTTPDPENLDFVVKDYETSFSIHNFRYVEISGLPLAPASDANFELRGIVLHTDATPTGNITFTGSGDTDKLNQLMEVIQRTQRYAMFGFFGDTARDERVGQVGTQFVQSSMYNYDMFQMYRRRMEALTDCMKPERGFSGKTQVPLWAPTTNRRHPDASKDQNPNLWNIPGYADELVELPWLYYVNYGDTRLLEDYFQNCQAYVDNVLLFNGKTFEYDSGEIFADNLDVDSYLSQHAQFNDWQNASNIDRSPWVSEGWRNLKQHDVDTQLFALVYLYQSVEFLGKIDVVLNDQTPVGSAVTSLSYEDTAKKIKNVFLKHFVETTGNPSGTQLSVYNGKGFTGISAGMQGPYALAIAMGLLEGERYDGSANVAVDANYKTYATNKLESLINDNIPDTSGVLDDHLDTGNHATWRAMRVLAENGQLQRFYDLLFQNSMPSWLYMIDSGATTIWENWDAYMPARKADTNDDGTGDGIDVPYQRETLNSFSFVQFGGVCESLYRHLAGINPVDDPEPEEAAYKKFIIRPRLATAVPGNAISGVTGNLETVHGRIVSRWSVSGAVFTLTVTVPVNTCADIYVPGDDDDDFSNTYQTKDTNGEPVTAWLTNPTSTTDGYGLYADVGSGVYTFTRTAQ